MARIPLIDPDDPGLAPATADLLRQMDQGTESGLYNMQRVIANHPELMQAFFGLAQTAYFSGSLTPKQAELPYLTSAIAIDCFY